MDLQLPCLHEKFGWLATVLPVVPELCKEARQRSTEGNSFEPQSICSFWGVAQGRIVCIEIESRHLLCTSLSMPCIYFHIFSYVGEVFFLISGLFVGIFQ